MGGYGKRVPVAQFKLYNRATKGRLPLSSSPVNFKTNWQPAHCQRDDELMMVTSRGIIIRQAVKAISPQSRSATGVQCSV